MKGKERLFFEAEEKELLARQLLEVSDRLMAVVKTHSSVVEGLLREAAELRSSAGDDRMKRRMSIA